MFVVIYSKTNVAVIKTITNICYFTSKVMKTFTHRPNGDSEELLFSHYRYVCHTHMHVIVRSQYYLIYFIIDRVHCFVNVLSSHNCRKVLEIHCHANC